MREPLVHFLLGGAALFLLFEWVGAPDAGRRERIVVGQDRVATLSRGFEAAWGRPPGEAELRALIDEYVMEEVLYREALALGLDRDDLVVRRRMRQKMEFLHEDLEARAPSEAELRAFLTANPQRFRTPARVTFEQVFVAPAPGGAPAGPRAEALLARLRDGEAPEALGDPTLLPASVSRATPSELAGRFGEAFAEAVAGLPESVWSGPVASAFGLHLVRVGAREPARMPPLEELRAPVELAWDAARRDEARQRFYSSLRDRYEVEVQLPEGLDVAAGP